jgi:dihydroneopterin aldolase
MPPTRSPNPDAPHLVAKLGGSLSASPALREWLAALRRYPHRLTIVPGGGPFADAVRAAQPMLGVSDAAAHEMALLAMEQYAVALADLAPGLAFVSTPREGAEAHRRGAIALWRPLAMTRAAPHIPASWDITSDSLAAWYAREAAADALLLVKSVDMGSDAPRDVAATIVDPCFALYARGLAVFLAGPGDLGLAGETSSRGIVPGAPFDITREQRIAS